MFECPFCMCPDGIVVELDKKVMKAKIKCRKCHCDEYTRSIGPITEAIDVYDEWMDTLVESNKQYNAERIENEPDYQDMSGEEEIIRDNQLKQISESSSSSDSEFSDTD